MSTSATAAGTRAYPKATDKIVHHLPDDHHSMSFSPGKMTPGTLNHFRKEESAGIPLQTSWTFWLDKWVTFSFLRYVMSWNGSSFSRTSKNSTAAEYKANLKKVYTVSTAQGFWSVLNHIPPVEELPIRCYYHLMREEKEPLWEDPMLSNGGVWRIKCAKRDTVNLMCHLVVGHDDVHIFHQYIDLPNTAE